MDAALSVFGNRLCPGCAQHQHLQGSNSRGSRTAQAAEWPKELDTLVAQCIAQQCLVDSELE
eukprot:9330939-Alexandrium_andersonii.AAC.1